MKLPGPGIITSCSLTLLALWTALACPRPALAVDIWTENFAGQNGKGLYGSSALGIVTNMSGITKWSVSGAGNLDGDTTLNWWMVTNGVFEGQDVGSSYGYWHSESIDVSSQGYLQVAMSLAQVGGGLDGSGNTFEVGYRLDGGTEHKLLTIDNSNQATFDGQAWTSAAIDASSASNITIEVRILASRMYNGWAFDNVAIQTAAPDQPPTLSAIGDQSVVSGQALTFDVIAIDTVDGDLVTLSASNLPSGAVFSPVSGIAPLTNTFTWASANPVGVYTTTFYAVDNDGAGFETIEINVAAFTGGGDRVWINEVHYDNTGSADTNEGFEIAGPAGVDLSEYVVYHYNGADGATYSPHTTPLSGTIDDEVNGHGAVWFGVDKDDLQNGPDGLALARVSDTETNLLQFLSYEGDFLATTGAADGIQSTDIGVEETTTTPLGHSLQLTGSGNVYADFTWTGPLEHTRGQLNLQQVITLKPTFFVIR